MSSEHDTTGPTLDDAITRILLAARELNEAALMLCAIKQPAPASEVTGDGRGVALPPVADEPAEQVSPPTFGGKKKQTDEYLTPTRSRPNGQE